jgi:hypothetical protein
MQALLASLRGRSIEEEHVERFHNSPAAAPDHIVAAWQKFKERSPATAGPR